VTGQTWLADILAGVMLATAAYCLSRLALSWRSGRPTDRPVDGAHVLMGVAMAGMLVPRLRIFYVGGWEVVFGLAAVGFAWLAGRELLAPSPAGTHPRHHHLQHVLACAAMVYMLAAVTTTAGGAGTSGMSGMSGGAMTAHFPTLAGVLVLGLCGYVVWNADRLTSLMRVAVPVTTATASAPVPDLVPAGGAGPAGGVALAGDGEALAPARQPQPGRSRPLSPRLTVCCEIAMGVTMGYMLILML
jgi:Domain of unknown function (DUF5134)